MSKRLSAFLLAMLAMGINPDVSYPRKQREDELDMYLRINNRTLEQEVELIKQKKSGLSTRLRNIAEYRMNKKAGA